MSVVVAPLSPERLAVTGDLEVELRIPLDDDNDEFLLAFSDGTLIAGIYDPGDDRFYFRPEVEGAGLSRIAEQRVELNWGVEWVTIGTRPRGLAFDLKP